MANPYDAAAAEEFTSIYRDKDFMQKHKDIDDAISRNNFRYLQSIVTEERMGGPVNLSEDNLISVLIAYGKSDLVVRLLDHVEPMSLLEANFEGDTALHVAAMKGDVKVSEALIERNSELLHKQNKQNETPLHKAALYGESAVFWKLIDRDSDHSAKRVDGATVLHCAVMGNAPSLALEIARRFPSLMSRRNSGGVTPLQLVVTIPYAFRSKLLLSPLETFVYKWISPDEDEEDNATYERQAGDEESKLESFNPPYQPVRVTDNAKGLSLPTKYRRKFPPNYATAFDLLALACIPAGWIRLLLFRVLKQMWSRVEELEQLKENHKQAVVLIRHLAKDPDYWDFIDKGKIPEDKNKSPSQAPVSLVSPSSKAMEPIVHGEPKPDKKDEPKDFNKQQWDELKELLLKISTKGEKKDETKRSDKKRWNESPLTLGAKMGLHEFVEQILMVCPQSARYLDTKGRNVLQVAIQNGHEKIVEIVESMAVGDNPVLPSWLLSSIDEKTKNTILHFAAEETVKEESAALQMQHELLWFERVRKLVPKDLEYSRNESEKTAQELFTENHKEMVKRGKDQLMEVGKTCSSLVAAVVFASSFSIPGEKDPDTHKPIFHDRPAFKVFSHAYVFGLSCAATALVLFLSLLTSRYREQDFRRTLPAQYLFANMSFFLALVSLLVAFSCNMYLNIWGEDTEREETRGIVQIVSELTIFPIVCCIVLFFQGFTFGLHSFLPRAWR